MKRKTFDGIATAGGGVLMVVLLVAGIMLAWGAHFANSEVHSQLAAQEITFPTATAFDHAAPGTEITPTMRQFIGQYAGKPLLTGAEAKAYATHFINVHLSEMPYGGVYAAVSAAARAHPTTKALQSEVTTVFKGTTLRGLLLEAYAFSVFGEIAGIAAAFAFGFAGLMVLLTLLGMIHFRRTGRQVELSIHREKDKAEVAA